MELESTVLKMLKIMSTTPASSSLIREHVLPSVVGLALLLIGQHFVRFSYKLELFLRYLLLLRPRVLVRVPLERLLPVGLLDRLRLRVPGHL